MPLPMSSSKAAMKEAIRREVHAGRPQKQAVAIAFSNQRKNKGKGR